MTISLTSLALDILQPCGNSPIHLAAGDENAIPISSADVTGAVTVIDAARGAECTVCP
jgi:hypothetical protein